MNPIETLLAECRRVGLVLFSDGDASRWRGPRPALELLVRLREHRTELRRHLADTASGLTADQLPWLHVARQVLAGEFAGANRSLRDSVSIGLRSIPHPLCLRALETLTAPKSRR